VQSIRCEHEKCAGHYTLIAEFCPRCGRRVNVPKRRRFRPFRLVLGLLLVVFVTRGVFRQRTASMPPPPPAPLIEQNEQTDTDIRPALFSPEAFFDARQSWSGSRSFAEVVAGKRVHWVGSLRPSWRPGTFNLVSADPDAIASIRMIPASARAKEQIKQIPANTTVEIEGVLRDDRSLHLLSIRTVE
jgi:hypothetical protein